jgi:hypothetical protein
MYPLQYNNKGGKKTVKSKKRKISLNLLCDGLLTLALPKYISRRW